MGAWRQVRAILLLPGMVAVVVPAVLVAATGSAAPGWGLPPPYSLLPLLAGVTAASIGLVLFVATVRMFATIGKGTLAPWDPTRKLVVQGVYRNVRNPMISGVAFVLLGESSILGSWPVLVWFAGFCLANAIYIPLVEEPGLLERFGADYLEYKRNVPRWIPRLRPWRPS
jgi:protein-S-isoprenylcysteine O-methyltransferase Ste14